ncbi:seryl-tRNA synthetase [Bacilli bacterium PM5-3]|nr:seryl-tRNA synthetase [Bacilli bacterium PM5-3]MDH6603774.1 seryl-tRNA synthetase [Bacilli bacterium PM5-9]
MANKPNINFDTLRESQQKSMELQKKNSEEAEKIKEEIERKRKKREEAKQAIIKKINEGANQEVTQLKSETKIRKNETPQNFFKRTNVREESLPSNIKVIKKDNNPIERNEIKSSQEKLSYTLQMDVISDEQVSAYQKRKQRTLGISIDDKFAKLTPTFTKIYIVVITVLLFLIAIALFIIQSINA